MKMLGTLAVAGCLFLTAGVVAILAMPQTVSLTDNVGTTYEGTYGGVYPKDGGMYGTTNYYYTVEATYISGVKQQGFLFFTPGFRVLKMIFFQNDVVPARAIECLWQGDGSVGYVTDSQGFVDGLFLRRAKAAKGKG
jgi:hypothetical protein